jgi:tuberculosinol/isotuberculosinol synthase
MESYLGLEEFLSLPVEEAAKIVRGDRTKTCVFPFNGTRRWFLLEHGREFSGDAAKRYVQLTTQAYISTYKLVFDHGLDNIIAPVFGGEILNRGEEYMREIGAGMSLLATHPAFLEFYEEYGVRVHFYGDYRKQLSGTPYATLCDDFDDITRKTAHNTKRALFYGVFAEDATVTISELAIRYYQDTGQHPSRADLVQRYYGEYIEKADIFIGYEKFNVFDYPMLGWGEESLYYTVAPSLYMTERQLRNILYDYVYLRPVQDPDYFTMPEADFESMRKYYEANREVTFGVGEIRGGIWYGNSNIIR